MLKAHVCRQAKALAPRLHNLVRLAEQSGLNLKTNQVGILAEMNQFNIEGRYPGTLPSPPTKAEAKRFMAQAGEVLEWLKEQF